MRNGRAWWVVLRYQVEVNAFTVFNHMNDVLGTNLRVVLPRETEVCDGPIRRPLVDNHVVSSYSLMHLGIWLLS